MTFISDLYNQTLTLDGIFGNMVLIAFSDDSADPDQVFT